MPDVDGMPTFGETIGAFAEEDTRTIWLFSELDDTRAQAFLQALHWFADADPTEPVHVRISSPGGNGYDGMAIVQAMRSLPCMVHTYIHGIACSMAAMIWAAGDVRYAEQASYLMFHEFSTSLEAFTGMAALETKVQSMRAWCAWASSYLAECSAVPKEIWLEVLEGRIGYDFSFSGIEEITKAFPGTQAIATYHRLRAPSGAPPAAPAQVLHHPRFAPTPGSAPPPAALPHANPTPEGESPGPSGNPAA